MNRVLSLALADADTVPTTSQANRHGLIVLTGSLTAPRLVMLPANHRRLELRNATTGGHAVTVGYAGGGATVAVAPDSTALLVGDGTNLHGGGPGGPGGAASLAGLDAVDIAGALNGDLLRFDGALWSPIDAGIVNRSLLPFRGALLRRTTDFNVSTTGAYIAVPWQSAAYDSDGFWDAGQPTRLTVPAGVTKVRLVANIEWLTSPTNQLVEIRKNGSTVLGGGAVIMRGDSGYYTFDSSLGGQAAAGPPQKCGTPYIIEDNAVASVLGEYMTGEISLDELLAEFQQRWDQAYGS